MPADNVLGDMVSDAIKAWKTGAVKTGYEEAPKAGRAYGEKIKMAREALRPLAPEPEPMTPVMPGAGVDKINPKAAKYGDRPGEKRPETMGTFKKGGEVPKTGVYKMHKGEQVMTPEQKNKMRDMLSLAESTLGHDAPPEPQKPPKEGRAMHVRKLDDKSFHIRHEHTHPMDHPDAEYSAKDLKELHKHMDDHWGEAKETPMEESQESPKVAMAEKAAGVE